MANVARPLLLIVAVLGFLIAVGLGPRTAQAAPALEAQGQCQPASVRPHEPVLITCTMSLANTGDETVASLVAILEPADGCAIPFPTLIDLSRDGELVPASPYQLSMDIGDLGPGETVEAVMRLAVINFDTGPTGGAIRVVSRDDPSVTATGQSCWDVSEDAGAPPTDLQITKMLLTEFEYPDPEPFPTPPPPPGDGQPVPIEPPPDPDYPDEAEYEVLISNVGATEIASLTVLDVQLGDAVLLAADPPITAIDALGRPTWDLSAFGAASLPPGEELRLVTTVGPPPEAYCSYAEDVVVVTAAPAGGESGGYVAFSDQWIPVGPCDYTPGDFCWHYPPEGEPTTAPCDQEVCWALPPGGDEYREVYDCDSGADYCWFVPPGEGEPELAPCGEEVCWFSYGDGEDYYYDVPCDVKFCQYTAPDASRSVRDWCDYPVCWSSPPEGGYWEEVWGCGQYTDGDYCWYTPPGDGGPSHLGSCDYPYRFAVNLPEGATDFGFGPDVVTFDGPACWPVPPGGGPFYTYVVPCDEIEYVRWLRPPNDGPAFPVYGDAEYCWEPVPPGIELPPGVELPDDLLIPTYCDEGEEGKVGVPGSSVPAEVVDGTSTPAEIVEGTVEKLDPAHSERVIPAEIVRTERVEPEAPPPDGSAGPEDGTPPRDRGPETPTRLADVLGLTQNQSDADGSEANVQGLPDSGVGAVSQEPAPWTWAIVVALAAGGLLLLAAAAALERRARL